MESNPKQPQLSDYSPAERQLLRALLEAVPAAHQALEEVPATIAHLDERIARQGPSPSPSRESSTRNS